MAKLKIITGANNPILRAMSVPVVKFDGALKKLAKGMKEAMIEANGIGIAAPQVGVNLRVFLAVLDVKSKGERTICLVNPEIVWKSEEMATGEEGCLSLPGEYGNVPRHKAVTVEFFSVDGVRQRLEFEDLNARVIQHENDHIDGVLFIDRTLGTMKEDEERVM